MACAQQRRNLAQQPCKFPHLGCTASGMGGFLRGFRFSGAGFLGPLPALLRR
jgi:hypothetical protein